MAAGSKDLARLSKPGWAGVLGLAVVIVLEIQQEAKVNG
jgi:hypothetical protein